MINLRLASALVSFRISRSLASVFLLYIMLLKLLIDFGLTMNCYDCILITFVVSGEHNLLLILP